MGSNIPVKVYISCTETSIKKVLQLPLQKKITLIKIKVMKAFTDILQSNKLAEFLPIESADMCYLSEESLFPKVNYNGMVFFNSEEEKPATIIPCWSLAALLDTLPSSTLDSSNDHHYRLHCMGRFTEWYDNPIDACVELIEKLHELKIL